MTISVADTIAEAVKTALNASGGPLFTATTKATRKHAFRYTLEEVARVDAATEEEPIITVFPKSYSRTRTSRTTWAYSHEIGVCVQAYCQFSDTTRIDELTLFVEGISDFITTAGHMANAPLMAATLDPIFDPQHLETANQFHSTPTFTFRYERST